MIDLRITNYEAIALQDLLGSLSLLTSSELPDAVKTELLQGYANKPELRSAGGKLRAELDNLMVAQQIRAGGGK